MPVRGRRTTELTKKIGIFLVLFLAALVCGCDPGYELRPNGWNIGDDGAWTKQFGDFEIQTRGIGGLIGEWWVDPDLQVHNNTKPISVESAELRTARERFTAEIYDNNPIPASTRGYHIPIKWKFDQKRAAPSVLGDHCEIVLNLSVGGESRQIKIEYER
jgi:hypothetical protein